VDNCRRPKKQPAKTPKTTPFDAAKTVRSSKLEGRAVIVALLNQKGGVGKTTLATHIAGELAMRGLHVVLLDADARRRHGLFAGAVEAGDRAATGAAARRHGARRRRVLGDWANKRGTSQLAIPTIIHRRAGL